MSSVLPQRHHTRGQECHSRPLYRRPRRATAVKVFTIADESVHLLVFGVPAVNLQDELTKLVQPFGDVSVFKVEDYPNLEEFTELFHLELTRIAAARAAKRRLDGLELFGGILHVCYAPELESLDETRSKLIQRSKQVYAKVRHNQPKLLSKFRARDVAGDSGVIS